MNTLTPQMSILQLRSCKIDAETAGLFHYPCLSILIILKEVVSMAEGESWQLLEKSMPTSFKQLFLHNRGKHLKVKFGMKLDMFPN